MAGRVNASRRGPQITLSLKDAAFVPLLTANDSDVVDLHKKASKVILVGPRHGIRN